MVFCPALPNRIIPALAGNTPASRCAAVPRRDHPRSRGEYPTWSNTEDMILGSSPLSRGIRMDRQSRRSFAGIIPALAGNTVAAKVKGRGARDHPRSRGEYRHWAYLIPPPRDHPRSRGEYLDTGELPAKYIGSSPLSRGIRPRSFGRPARSRIIPALAGNTPGPHP